MVGRCGGGEEIIIVIIIRNEVVLGEGWGIIELDVVKVVSARPWARELIMVGGVPRLWMPLRGSDGCLHWGVRWWWLERRGRHFNYLFNYPANQT